MITFDEARTHLIAARVCGTSIRARCPLCDGKHLSLTRFPDGGACLHCFSCNATQRELREAVMGGTVVETISRLAKPMVEITDAQRIAKARGIWRNTVPAAGTLVEQYLHNRAINSVPPTIRFHLRLKAMVAVIVDLQRHMKGVQVTYLKDGGFKADCDPNKQTFGVVRGCAVHLGPISEGRLAIAEGVESGLSFQEASGVATWATLGTSGMTTVEIPAGITRLTIAADLDDAGINAAQTLGGRLEEDRPDIELSIETIGLDYGEDWNDLAQREAEP